MKEALLQLRRLLGHRSAEPTEGGESALGPALEDCINPGKHSAARLVPLPTATEQLIVLCVNVSNVGANGQRNRVRIESLGIGGATDAPGILETSMLCNRDRLYLGASGIEIANVSGKLATIMEVDSCLPLSSPLAGARSHVAVAQTLLFGASQGSFINQDTLPLVSIAGATKSNHHSTKRGIAARSSRQGSIAARQEEKMREVGARHAQGTLLFEPEQLPLAELLAALGAGRVTEDLKNNDVV